MANRSWIGGDPTDPGKFDVAANWSPATIPVNGDDVFFEYGAQALDDSLDQSAITLATLTISQSYTGLMGLQDTFFQIGATICTIGEHKGSAAPGGSTRINLDLGTAGTTCTVFKTASAANDSFRSPLRLKLVNTASVLILRDGKISIADDPDDATTVSKIDIRGGTIKVGDGVLINSILMKGGTCDSFSGINNGATPTVQVDGGALNLDTTDATTTITVELTGTVNFKRSGVVTTINAKGILDWNGSTTARTVTNVNLFKNATLSYDPNIVTFTNDVVVDTSVPIIIQTT